MTLTHDIAKCPQDIGLGLGIHRQIRILPITQHTQALKVFALSGDLFLGEGSTGVTKFFGGYRITRLADGLLDLVLNRQAVAVPAWDIDSIVAVETARFDNNILEDFVHGMADMNIAIRIGGAIMQDVALAPAAAGPQSLVNAFIAPARQTHRLAFGKPCAHRKRCFREIESVLVIAHEFILQS